MLVIKGLLIAITAVILTLILIVLVEVTVKTIIELLKGKGK